MIATITNSPRRNVLKVIEYLTSGPCSPNPTPTSIPILVALLDMIFKVVMHLKTNFYN
jgi:hypothetical protein